MRRLLNSLLFRVAAICLLGLVAIQAAIIAAAIWPDGQPMSFRLVTPRDVREIAEAVERAPPNLRTTVVAAVGNDATVVRLLPSAVPTGSDPPGLRPAPHLEPRFRHYAAELEGRPIEVQARKGLLASGLGGEEPPPGPVRLLVTLRTGEVLAIERAPLVLHLLAGRYLVIALVAGLVLAVLTGTLFWQVVRPVARLGRATAAFSNDMKAPDAPVAGAREIQALAAGFNAMKHRIGGLVGERTRMLAAIAHDLRTCLTRLRLRVDQIQDPRQRERAAGDVEEMGRLLEDILLFARIDADGEREPPVIDACAEAEAYVGMRREIGDDVEIERPARPLTARCAPVAFRRILANLVDNAIRYGTRARVSLDAETGMTVLRVSDDGTGIPPALVERLTAPFERLDQSRGRHSGGAGLGLSIVKGLAESHGGSLALENRPSGGLQAIVRLPAGLGAGPSQG